jgi:hypothetical protein
LKSRRRFMLLYKARSKVCAIARRFDAAAACDLRPRSSQVRYFSIERQSKRSCQSPATRPLWSPATDG